MVAKVRGRFTSYDVTIVTSQDPTGLVGCRDDRPGVRRHRQRTA
jgi:hypothetical protein